MQAEADAKEAALALIASLHVCSLATGADGRPHAASLMYAHEGFRLFWFSDPATEHSRHIDAAPSARAAVTIAADHQDFATIRGVQMVGVARRVTNPREMTAALALLTGRYGFLARARGGPERLAEALRKAAIYRFTPDRITLIDNTKGFGHKITFDPGG
ncbi:MAG: pyridoxamine 5'-phosphate oxidase family protein [Alphaproteobacteria bacterium]|nr:pyridoxamine 5'-phosphate oxidase family protein [Alphaproteobacteria bacterium]